MISILKSLFDNIFLSLSIVLFNSSNSSLNFSCSRPVNCLNLISTIAFACISVSSNWSCKLFFADSVFSDDLISSITLSILSEATIRPFNMCALSSAFFNSYLDLLTTTSCLCSTKLLISSFKFNNFGLPLTKAILLTLKDDCSWVNL